MQFFQNIIKWFNKNAFSYDMLMPLGIILLIFLATYFVSRFVERYIRKKKDVFVRKGSFFKYLFKLAESIFFPFLSLIFLWLFQVISLSLGQKYPLIDVSVNLLTAWVVIRSVSFFVTNNSFSKFVAILIWVVTALNIFGVLNPILKTLDDLVFHVGDISISVLTAIKGIFILSVILWITSALSNLSKRYIHNISELTPSTQVLLSKLVRILLLTIAIVVGLNSIGINLTSFAVFSGAVGIGVGFGLQKVISNFISGIILLMDKSIKPGDVVAIGETYGWVNSLGARYVSVITRDGKEHLIPNEALITEKVENWSFSNSEVRIRIPIGISYDSDVDKAIEIAIEAAQEVPRVLDRPLPVCLLTGFGDSSVDLELRIWISDPSNGMKNVQSKVLLNVWHKFHEHDIHFPFPQRDVFIKNLDPKLLQKKKA